MAKLYLYIEMLLAGSFFWQLDSRLSSVFVVFSLDKQEMQWLICSYSSD